jgi:hypothetical protein
LRIGPPRFGQYSRPLFSGFECTPRSWKNLLLSASTITERNLKPNSLFIPLVVFVIVFAGFAFIFQGNEILGPFLVLIGVIVTIGAISRHWRGPLTLLGLVVFIGGTLVSLYLIFGRCAPNGGVLPNGVCYVYNSNNLWFATASLLIPLLGLAILAADLLRTEKSPG